MVGLHCKPENSELTPTQCSTFLGAAIDIPAGLAQLRSDRIDTVVAAAIQLRCCQLAPARVDPVSRVSGELDGCFARLPPADETLPTASSQILSSLEGPTYTVDTQSIAEPHGASTLDQEGQPVDRPYPC